MMKDEIPLFDSLWQYGDPAGTRERFMALLPEAEAGDDVSHLAQLLTQIARTYGLETEFAQAHQWLDRAEGLLTPALVTATIRYWLERGRTFNSSGEKAKAHSLFEQAWQLASTHEAEQFYAVDAAHMLGIVGETTASRLDWNEQAMALAETAVHPNTRRWLGSLYNNIGWTYHEMGDYKKALTIFQKGLAWHQNEVPPRQERIETARWTVARALRSLGHVTEALQQQQALAQEIAQQDGYVYEEIAECLLALGQKEEARSYFGQAYQLLSQDKWLIRDEPERLARMQALWQND